MASKTTNRFSPEVRTLAVRLVFEHEKDHSSRWATVTSIAAKIGCTAQTLHQWVGRAERDSGRKPGLTTDMAAKLKTLERENRGLRQANEILRKASAYFDGVDAPARRHCNVSLADPSAGHEKERHPCLKLRLSALTSRSGSFSCTALRRTALYSFERS